MKRLISVIVLSFTLSVVFTFTANAEFSIYDSNNLSSIASDAASLESYTRSISSTLSSVSSTVNYIYNSVSSIYTNSNYLPTISTTLNNISSSLSYLSSIQSNTAKLSDIEENTSHLSDISTSVSSLPSIDNNVEGIYSSTSNIFDQLTNFYSSFNSFLTTFGSFESQVYKYYNDFNNYLNDILYSNYYQFLGEDALFYFSEKYFNRIYVESDGTGIFDGLMPVLSNTNFFYLYRLVNNRLVDLYFDTGTYYIVVSSNVSDITIYFEWVDQSYYSVSLVNSVNYQGYYNVYSLTVNTPFSCNAIVFRSTDDFNCYLYGGICRASLDDIAGSSVNPDQDGTVSDVDDAGEQQSLQEDQMWQNINTYKGDISFNLDGWDDAAGGLSYVTGVFMTIWNNSPTQPIVLSLMLGIAMLSIGRGVMAAVRVSRNRGDD